MDYSIHFHGLQYEIPWITVYISMDYSIQFHRLQYAIPWITVCNSMDYSIHFHGIQYEIPWITVCNSTKIPSVSHTVMRIYCLIDGFIHLQGRNVP
jgi:uncharacterized membrane protein YkvI